MKKTILFLGAILFVFAFCLCTGVDQNPWQAIIALPMMGGALVCFKTAKRLEQKKQSNESIGGVIRDAA